MTSCWMQMRSCQTCQYSKKGKAGETRSDGRYVRYPLCRCGVDDKKPYWHWCPKGALKVYDERQGGKPLRGSMDIGKALFPVEPLPKVPIGVWRKTPEGCLDVWDEQPGASRG
jgi:hypothetical protein